MNINRLTVDDWVHVNPHRMQQVARWATRRIGRLLFRYRGYGSERIPAEGGFIIAPNHGSYLDGFFFGHGTRRTVRFMAKFEALEWPVVGRVIRWCGGFPVTRGATGQPAFAVAEHILDAGHGLIMFMEGKLVRTPELGTPFNGLARLALRTGVPVVPVAAWGNKPAWVYGRRRFASWPRTTVVWGEPMQFARVDEPRDELIGDTRDAIWSEVARLHGIARQLHERQGKRPRTFEIPARESVRSSSAPVESVID